MSDALEDHKNSVTIEGYIFINFCFTDDIVVIKLVLTGPSRLERITSDLLKDQKDSVSVGG